MPRNSFLKHLDQVSSTIFRYLLYLSRNNCWVTVGDDVYQLIIKHQVHDEEHESIHADSSTENEDKLKLFLSEREYSRTTLSGGYHDEYLGEYSEFVSSLNLNVDAFFYHRLAIS